MPYNMKYCALTTFICQATLALGAPQNDGGNQSVGEATSSEHLRGSQGHLKARLASTEGSQLVVNVLNSAARSVTLAASCHKPNYTLRSGDSVQLQITEAGRLWLVGRDSAWDCRKGCDDCFYLVSRFSANHTMEANIGLGALDAALKHNAHDTEANTSGAFSQDVMDEAAAGTTGKNGGGVDIGHIDTNISDGDDDDGDEEPSDEDDNANEAISAVEIIPQFSARAATCTRRQCDLRRFVNSAGNLTLVVHGSESKPQGSNAINTTVGTEKGLMDNSRDVMVQGRWHDGRRRDWDDRRRDDRRRRIDFDRRRDDRRRDWDRRRRSHDHCHHWHCSEHPHHHCWCH